MTKRGCPFCNYDHPLPYPDPQHDPWPVEREITATQRKALELLARGFGRTRQRDDPTMNALEKAGLVGSINGFDGVRWEMTNQGYSSLKRSKPLA